MSPTIEGYAWKFPHEKVKIPFSQRSKVRWPEGKILAVPVYVAQEWFGRDYLPGEGRVLDISGLSYKEDYNFDVGIWRALNLLDKYELKATFPTSGAGAKYYPEAIKEVAQRGHEIAAHGFYQSRASARLNEKEELEDIVKTRSILESVSGQRPLGWSNPDVSCSERTMELLVKEGFLWNGDLQDDDLPYGIKVKDNILVQIPHRTITTNDFSWFSGRLGILSTIKAQRSPGEAVSFFKETLDGYHETAKREGGLLFHFGIHPFISCTPDRIGAIAKMLEYMKGFPDIWFCTRNVLARFWRDNYL